MVKGKVGDAQQERPQLSSINLTPYASLFTSPFSLNSNLAVRFDALSKAYVLTNIVWTS